MDKCTHEVRKQYWKNIINRKRQTMCQSFTAQLHHGNVHYWAYLTTFASRCEMAVCNMALVSSIGYAY